MADSTPGRTSALVSIEQLYEALREPLKANDQARVSQICADLVRDGQPISEIARRLQALAEPPAQQQTEPSPRNPLENPSVPSSGAVNPEAPIRVVDPDPATPANPWPASLDISTGEWGLPPISGDNRPETCGGQSVQGASAPGRESPALGSVRQAAGQALIHTQALPSGELGSSSKRGQQTATLAAAAAVVSIGIFLLIALGATDAGPATSRDYMGILVDAAKPVPDDDNSRSAKLAAEEPAPGAALASSTLETESAPAGSPTDMAVAADMAVGTALSQAARIEITDPMPTATPDLLLTTAPAAMAPLSSPVAYPAIIREPNKDEPNTEAPNENSPAVPMTSAAESSAAPPPTVSADAEPPTGRPEASTTVASLQPREAAPNDVGLPQTAWPAAKNNQQPAQQPIPAEAAFLLERGDRLFGLGDLASARLFYERGAEAGSAQAALRLGGTYDPAFLKQARLRLSSDPKLAAFWYRRAQELGATEAEILLNAMRSAGQ